MSQATKTPHALADKSPGNTSGLLAGTGAALLTQVQRTAFSACVPLNATIEITQRCNLRCLHCYNFDRDNELRPQLSELATSEIVSVMDELQQAGCLFLSLTGGELFSHPDLFVLLDEARKRNFAVQLLSNGTLLRPGVVGKLARLPNLTGVSLSLYGASHGVHDHITQRPGSCARTWEGAERLRKQGISVRLKFILMQHNAHEAEAMMAQANDCGFAFAIDFVITARHDGTRSSLGSRIDKTQLETLFHGPLRAFLPKGKCQPEDPSAPCNCARANCAITATGDVLPCISVPWVAGNIRRQSFAQIWNHSEVFQTIRGYMLSDYTACAPCEHKKWCTRSRGAAYTHAGSYTGTDPLICAAAELAHSLNPADETR